MKNCGNKIKHTCSEKNYATCVYYELEVPSFSSLVDEDCKTLEETTEDQYTILNNIIGDLDTGRLGDSCIIYNTDTPRGTLLTVKEVIYQLEQTICVLQNRVEELETLAVCDINITNCGIDLSGINNNCSSPVTTLGELLAYLVDNTQTP